MYLQSSQVEGQCGDDVGLEADAEGTQKVVDGPEEWEQNGDEEDEARCVHARTPSDGRSPRMNHKAALVWNDYDASFNLLRVV